MKFIFVSNTCSDSEYKRLQDIKFKNKLNPSQKYYDLLIKGFMDIGKDSFVCLTRRNISPGTCHEKALPFKKEVISDNLTFLYTKVVNKSVIKNLFGFFDGFFYTLKLIKDFKSQGEEVVLLSDPLVYDISFGAVLAARLRRIKTAAVITDLPTYLEQTVSSGKKLGMTRRLRAFITNTLLDFFHGYCFLTESMNIINKKNKPYVIAEGMVEAKGEMDWDNSVEKNILLYAGGLYEKFGTKNLVDACRSIDIPGFELHLYGEGSCEDYIKAAEAESCQIKYKGVVSLAEILDAEKSAKVLINTRPTENEFTKFSFPSKTLEYMSAARPVLTTRLAGIPDEYFEYIHPIGDETVDGLKTAICDIFEKDSAQLDQEGERVFDFVQQKKNNKIQAQKVRSLFE